MRLRNKIALVMIASQTVLITAMMVRSINGEVTRTHEAISSYSRMLAKTIAGRWIEDIIAGSSMDRAELARFTSVVRSFDDRIACVVITDRDRRLLAGDLNERWVESSGPRNAVLEKLAFEDLPAMSFKSVSVDIDSNGTYLGSIRIVFSLALMKRQIALSAAAWAAVWVVLSLAGMLASVFISRKVTRPLGIVEEAMSRVESGDLNQKVTVTTADEVGRMAKAFNKMTEGLREREFIKNTFSKYVSQQVADRILKERDFLKLAGEKRVVTVLFADIRGFTPLAETLPPEKVLEILNLYFSSMVDIVFRYGGLLNKFIGDAIMVVYNAPLDQKYHELRAILTGIAIQKEISRINEERRMGGEVQVSIGIGINTGEAVAGNVGSELRLEYTVIGSGVNLAQRIESRTERGQLLISDSTYAAVRDYVDVVSLEPVQVKGVHDPVQLYAVVSVRTPDDFNETS